MRRMEDLHQPKDTGERGLKGDGSTKAGEHLPNQGRLHPSESSDPTEALRLASTLSEQNRARASLGSVGLVETLDTRPDSVSLEGEIQLTPGPSASTTKGDPLALIQHLAHLPNPITDRTGSIGAELSTVAKGSNQKGASLPVRRNLIRWHRLRPVWDKKTTIHTAWLRRSWPSVWPLIQHSLRQHSVPHTRSRMQCLLMALSKSFGTLEQLTPSPMTARTSLDQSDLWESARLSLV